MTIWKIDTVHSEVNFKVKHLVVSTVRGGFDKFNVTIETNYDDFSDAKIKFEANINSINTRNADRDAHLKSADFFNAEINPKIVFESKSIKPVSDYEMEVIGNLTIHGITREIKLDAIYNGIVSGIGNAKVAGFEIHGKLNRFDYGLKWNGLTEIGGVIVSNEVQIEILAEFNEIQTDTKAA
jgi:polyisoprenoid-binding protein YceI